MNKIDFLPQQGNGFPLDCDVLDFMQNSWSVFNQLGHMAGNLSILTGCEAQGSSIKDGFVYINGEVLPFVGGPIGSHVIIKEDAEKLVFETGGELPVIKKRVACFGVNPTNQWPWADFVRPKNQQQQDTKLDELNHNLLAIGQRLNIMEKSLPIGLVAIWDKPETSPIPPGWVEHTELAGRTVFGWEPYPAGSKNFGNLGSNGGNYKVYISENNLPTFSYPDNQFKSISNDWKGGGNESPANDTGHNTTGTNVRYGKNEPINIINPHRIVRFIRFVGFDPKNNLVSKKGTFVYMENEAWDNKISTDGDEVSVVSGFLGTGLINAFVPNRGQRFLVKIFVKFKTPLANNTYDVLLDIKNENQDNLNPIIKSQSVDGFEIEFGGSVSLNAFVLNYSIKL